MSNATFITAGVLFVLLVAGSMFVYAAAISAWSLARRRHTGSRSPVLDWEPNEPEGSLKSGAAFLEFFFARAHRRLNDPEIDELCARVRCGMAVQFLLGAVLLYVTSHA